MRRLVALLLLALFSLQSSWAVAAAYCDYKAEHQTQRDAAHFGHHAEGHAQAAAADDGATTGADAHCHDCHACCACLVPPAFQAQPQLAGAAVPLQALGVRLPAAPVLPLERPNWRPFA